MLCQYLYISTAPSLSREEVESILSSSTRNNAERGITGLLLYNGRNFLQLLEGEEAELIALMVRISHDPRHSGISILDKRAIDVRSCAGWAMNQVLISDNVEKRRELLAGELPKALDPQIRQIIVNFALLN